MEEIKISKDYLKQLIDFQSSKAVGKIMKRFEIIEEKSVLKKDIKELLYENYRELRDLILAYNDGREITVFKFKTKPKQ